jgi:2-polyprenyl-3-methyl-5-hydroxy-6-metoxy-1,4-benzoquinol methylase
MNEKESHKDEVGEATLNIISKADKFNRWMYETIRPFLKGDILEVGSGIGNISKCLISDNLSITLSDYNSAYRDNLEKEYSHFKNVKSIINIDLQHPEFEKNYGGYKGKFDTIFMLNVIEHLADDFQALKNCRFLLRQEGYLIALAPAYRFLFCRLDQQLGHYRRYTSRSLSAVFQKAGLLVLKIKYFNYLGIAGWLVSGKIFRSRTLGKNEMSAFNKLVPLAKMLDKMIFNKAGLSVIVWAQKI